MQWVVDITRLRELTLIDYYQEASLAILSGHFMVLAGVAARLRLGISDEQIDGAHEGWLVRVFTLLVHGL